MSWLGLLRAGGLFKYEIRIVLGVISFILILPAIVVVVLADSGLSAVSNALATINPVNHMIEIRNPDGKVVAQMEAVTTWPATGSVTQEFGVPNPPYEAHHSGIDIAGKKFDPITTFMAGTVTGAGAVSTGCGQCVIVDHGNNVTSSYSHMSTVLVSKGQQVKPGDVLGLEGDTGWAFGVHVHFMIRVYGMPVDPRTFMVGEPSRL